jgi:3-hydroxyisobutyrate dehydrogenase
MNTELTKVAFLGLGAMGQRMARRLSDAGVALTVWSRSGSTRSELQGVTHAPTIAAAVAGADVVMAMVRDDAASREVWLGPEGACAHLRQGAIAVEHSTLAPAWITELSAALHSAGALFVEAPVVGSRPQAESGNLIFLAGGPSETLARVRPLLAAMGSAVHHLGDAPAGAHTKLIVNTLFAVQVAALAELLGLGAKAGLNASALLEVLSGLPVLSGAAKGAAAGMVAGAFEPMFPVELVTKDLRYALTAAESAGAQLPIGKSAHGVFEAGLTSGLGGENLTAVTKLYR